MLSAAFREPTERAGPPSLRQVPSSWREGRLCPHPGPFRRMLAHRARTELIGGGSCLQSELAQAGQRLLAVRSPVVLVHPPARLRLHYEPLPWPHGPGPFLGRQGTAPTPGFP